MDASGVRIVGFDCAEEEHSAALLNEEGEFNSRIDPDFFDTSRPASAGRFFAHFRQGESTDPEAWWPAPARGQYLAKIVTAPSSPEFWSFEGAEIPRLSSE